jgi:AraC-like DNA-binding protein
LNGIDREVELAERDRAVFWQHPHFSDMGLLKARFRRHRYSLHTHPTYVIALITDGCESLRVARRRETAPTNAVIVVNPEECHDGEAGCDDGWAYRTFYPTVELMAALAQELDQASLPSFPLAILTDPILAADLARAHRSAELGDKVDAEATMLVALGRLITGYADRSHRVRVRTGVGVARRMAIYRDMIEGDLAGSFELAHFAVATGVTRFQVIRDFKQETGLTPSAFIRDRRVLRASRMIQTGETLANASIAAGFADQSHLSRAFKRARGFTPGVLRQVFASRETQ